MTGWNIIVYLAIGSIRTVEVVWGKDIQNLWCGQISIVVTYKDRERHRIIYWKGFWGNKPTSSHTSLEQPYLGQRTDMAAQGEPNPPPPPLNPSRLICGISLHVQDVTLKAETACPWHRANLKPTQLEKKH